MMDFYIAAIQQTMQRDVEKQRDVELVKDVLQLTVENVTFVRINLSLEGRECVNSVACREGAKGLNSCVMVSCELVSPEVRPYSVHVM